MRFLVEVRWRQHQARDTHHETLRSHLIGEHPHARSAVPRQARAHRKKIPTKTPTPPILQKRKDPQKNSFATSAMENMKRANVPITRKKGNFE